MQAPPDKQKRTIPFKDKEARKRFVANYHRLVAGKLLCKDHKTTPAVGICNYCGYGICGACAVVFGLKRYCKEDAEFLLKRARVGHEVTQRGTALSIAAVLSEVNGLWAVSIGFLLIVIGMLGPAVETSPIVASSVAGFKSYFGEVFLFPASQTIFVGGLSFMAGLVDMISGYFVWKRSKLWAIVSVGAAVFGPLFTASYFQILAIGGVLTFVILGAGITKIALVGLGWKRLK